MTHKTEPLSLSEVAAQAIDDLAPLTQTLRDLGIPRATFYRHTEIPRFRRGGRIFVSRRTLAPLLARRRGGAK
jgi:hypothetical protein